MLGIGRTSRIQEAPIQRLLDESEVPEDNVSLGQGVPFFGPPEEAMDAASEVLRNPDGYRYTEDPGRLSLRESLATKLQRENNIEADPEENIVATTGANQAFVNALFALTDEGDEVIIVLPHYFNHVMAIRMADCRPVLVESDEHYLPSPDKIFSKVTSDTRAVVTISPNNPTGAVYPPSLLEEINKRCKESDIYHISDEAYEYFVYGTDHVSPASFEDGLSNTISIFTFSKSYGMPGYRIGYMVVPSDIYDEVLKVQDTVAICPPGPSQAAAEAALEVGPEYPRSFLSKLSEVRNVFIDGVEGIEKVYLPVTNGGFYFLIDLETDCSTWDISRRLIQDYEVITIPGEAFGAPGKLRISYGNIERDTAKEGIRRLREGLEVLL